MKQNTQTLQRIIMHHYVQLKKIYVQLKKISLTKTETSYIVALLNGTNCQFVDYKYWKRGHFTFNFVQLWAILWQWPKKFMIFDI